MRNGGYPKSEHLHVGSNVTINWKQVSDLVGDQPFSGAVDGWTEEPLRKEQLF